jgi:hypothetical protein
MSTAPCSQLALEVLACEAAPPRLPAAASRRANARLTPFAPFEVQRTPLRLDAAFRG